MNDRLVTEHLGLAFNPFTPATSEEGYFYTSQTQRILQELHFGIVSRKGFLLLLGEVGVGKTSLLLQLLKSLHTQEGLHTAWVFHTSLDRRELLRAIISDFGLQAPSPASLSRMLEILHSHFLQVNENGGNCAIIVDEAHNLSQQALESLRMLSNLEGGGQKLVQILLAGQPELKQTLATTGLRQLQSRIYLQCELLPMNKEEVRRYCSFKLARAGSHIRITSPASALLWRASKGNTRAVNLILDRALHALALEDSRTLSRGSVRKALQEISSHHLLIRQNLRSSRRKRGVSLATAAVTLLLLTGIYFPVTGSPVPGVTHLQLGPFLETTGRAVQQDKEGSAAESREEESSLAGQSQKDSPEDTRQPPENAEEKLLTFLQTFDIDNKLYFLQQAMATGEIEHFRSQLPSGLYLTGVENLPDARGTRFASLPWRDLTGQDPRWYILWKPILELDLEDPRESSPSHIAILQTLLQEKGYYPGRIDGKYGPRTRSAIRSYQQSRGLDTEQGLDAVTLFHLCRDLEQRESRAAGD